MIQHNVHYKMTNNKKATIYTDYFKLQEQYENEYGKEKTIVFMQVGDFYESYMVPGKCGHDLHKISKLTDCNVVCTNHSKAIGQSNPNLLGFKPQSLLSKVKKLTDNGYTVVVYDQALDTTGKHTRVLGNIYSSGTTIVDVGSKEDCYLFSIYVKYEQQLNGATLPCIGFSCIDMSTGNNMVYEKLPSSFDPNISFDETARFIHALCPKEVLLYVDGPVERNYVIDKLSLNGTIIRYNDKFDKNILKPSYQNRVLEKIFKPGSLSALEYVGLGRMEYGAVSYVCLLDFAFKHNEKIMKTIEIPKIYDSENNLILYNDALYQLNIYENNDTYINTCRFNSVYSVVNNTVTNLGHRFLKQTLAHPITDVNELNNRYNCIEVITTELLSGVLDNELWNISDIGRLHRKLFSSLLDPSDLIKLIISYGATLKLNTICGKYELLKKYSLSSEIVKLIGHFLETCNRYFKVDILANYNKIVNNSEEYISYFKVGAVKEVDDALKKPNKLYERLQIFTNAINAKLKGDGKVYKKGIKLRETNKEGFCFQTDNSTGSRLKSLTESTLKRIWIGEENANPPTESEDLIDISDFYYTKQKTSTKITSGYLKKISDEIKGNSETLRHLEKKHFTNILQELVRSCGTMFTEVVNYVSIIDFLNSAAKTAKMYNFTKPTLVDNHKSFIDAKQLRHPIIERLIKHEYVPHDVYVGGEGTVDGMLIFGINAAGKSSLMKALGISVVLAQSGMYVPATSYVLCPYKSLFARINGNDNLFRSQSSFELEMFELHHILKRANSNSLVIGDEICRGTEHISGTAIVATSVLELAKRKCSFMFATHLHELAKMEKILQIQNLKMCHLTVEYDSVNDCLVYDRILKDGSGDTIYGITVAKYIIGDNEFNRTAQEIKNELVGMSNTLIDCKTSRYNPDVFMNCCSVCGVGIKLKEVGSLETHHINFQVNCDTNGFVIDKPYLYKNHFSNLVVLCSKCHDNVHSGNINIEGYVKTSKGTKLKINGSLIN